MATSARQRLVRDVAAEHFGDVVSVRGASAGDTPPFPEHPMDMVN